MKRLSLLFLLCAASCVNLEKPRAYRCQSSNDCIEPWVCLRDNFCHDPSIGIDVACESAADCVAGWYCGKDGRCRDPEKPSALVCDDDTQCATGWFCSREGVCRDRSVPAAFPCEVDPECAGGWRCSTEGLCVDVSDEVTMPSLAPLATTVRRSPLAPLAVQLHAAPVQVEKDSFGEPLLLQQALLDLVDGGVLVAALASASNGETVVVRQTLAPVAWPSRVFDMEINGEWILVLDDQSKLWLYGRSALTSFDAGAPVYDIKPLLLPSEDGGLPLAAFGMKRTNASSALILVPETGETFELGKAPVRDFTFLDGVGPLTRFAVVYEADSAGLSTVDTVRRDGATQRVFAVEARDGGAVNGVRSSGLTLAMHIEIGDGSLRSTSVVQSFTLSNVGMPRLNAPVQCPQSGLLSEYAISSQGALDLACAVNADTGYVWRRDDGASMVSPLREFTANTVAGISGSVVRQLSTGALRFGGSLENDVATVLDRHADRLGAFGDGSIAAVREAALYLSNTESGDALKQGLALVQYAPDAGSTHVATFIEGSRAWLWSNGIAIEAGVDGGADVYPWVFEGLPKLQRPLARVVRAREGPVFVASDGDALWAAAVSDGGVAATVRATARPAPGFPVSSWIAGPADGGLLEGWATANNRLFRLSASSVERWKVIEVPVTGRDPLTVFFHGAAPRLGTTRGEVLSLPSRVPVAPAFSDAVTSMDSVRGVVFATSDEGVFQLVEDGGVTQWQAVPGTSALRRPIVQKFEQRVFVTSETGVVFELND